MWTTAQPQFFNHITHNYDQYFDILSNKWNTTFFIHKKTAKKCTYIHHQQYTSYKIGISLHTGMSISKVDLHQQE